MRGIPVSYRSVDEWIVEGLLPPAEPTATGPKQRGRPQKLYGQQAFEAVCWLGVHRRFIEGADAVRFWMRLEGFTYVQVDLGAVLRARLQKLWRTLQERVSGLPALDDLALGRGYAQEEIDAISLRLHDLLDDPAPASEQDHHEDASATELVEAVLGLLPAETLQPYDNLDGVDGEDVDRSPADACFQNDGSPWLPRMRAFLPSLIRGATLIDLYRTLLKKPLPDGLLENAWAYLTPEALAALWHLPWTPRVRAFLNSLGEHATFMRLLDYDPAYLVLFLVQITQVLRPRAQAELDTVAQQLQKEM